MNKKIRLTALLVALSISLLSSGCSDAEKAVLRAYGNKHKIEMYSGGKKVREWVSSGKVHSSPDSDGYYFNDDGSGMLISVSGDVVITMIK